MPTTDTVEMQLAPPQGGEEPMKQLAPFSTLEQEARKMIADAEAIALLPPTAANAKVARAMRLEIKPLRVAVVKRHAELKRPILDDGNALDAGKNALLDLLEPMEAKLMAIEQYAEREAERIYAEKRTTRTAELTQFVHSDSIIVDLGTMTDEAYASTLTDAKDAQAARLEREAKERADAEAVTIAERERIEAQRLENERLKAEAAQREEAARKEREEAAERERIAAEKAKAEADKARKEREASEAAAAKENARLAGIAEEQRKQAAKLAAELAKKKADEDKLAAEKLAAEKAAALAPERNKLITLAAVIRGTTMPTMTTQQGISTLALISTKCEAFAVWIEKQAEAL